MASPFVYVAGDRLTLAELCAARLDGDVIELGDAYTPTDTVETTWLRAASLRPLAPSTLAVTHLSAAWVHGLLAVPPHRHTVQRAVGRRSQRLPDRMLIYRDLVVDHDYLMTIADVLVTTPAKTLSDLLRVQDTEYHAAARGIVRAEPDLARKARSILQAGSLPYKREALNLLEGWGGTGYDEVTR
ncbi:hypothetical protein [Microbacterium sp. C7(2022)]|uniref:hypothetical protein n=1 Tax=Microbacterium sp. C7(2022) TaxID=2992759 RepID=UPI00237C1DED|nr:hypothetical protein [Microbacterium sp. C7(2022)]MDE0545530.1 hypothetical protein [Microbacterium sp. C7(2022)]